MSSLTNIPAPIGTKVPHDVIFGEVKDQNRGIKPFKNQRMRNDNYFWMRSDDRKDEKVLAHLVSFICSLNSNTTAIGYVLTFHLLFRHLQNRYFFYLHLLCRHWIIPKPTRPSLNLRSPSAASRKCLFRTRTEPTCRFEKNFV